MEEYKPGRRNRYVLDRAMDHLKSVPYKPTSRWLFYRLLQDGYYHDKDDYKVRWSPLCSRARKNFYGEWTPDTLADETRDRIPRVGDFRDRAHIKAELAEYVVENVTLSYDHFYQQEEFVIIGFEARAMVEQFLYYTEGIDLLPFGGDASIPLKWQIAKHLENCHRWYGGIPLRLLYFGDYDKKGGKIFRAAMKDIEKWCDCEIQYAWCGLTEDQAESFALPENPEKPGQYQWEALTDEQAREIILSAMAAFHVDMDLISAKRAEGEKVTEEWRRKIQKALTPLVKRWRS
jgi:hypothetical protein